MFRIRINSVEIPYSFSNLSSTINTLNVSVHNHLGEQKTGSVMFQVGNYGVSTILSELKKLLLEFCASAVAGFTPFVPILNLTYDKNSGKCSYATNAGNFTLHFDENKALGMFFGFDSDCVFTIGNSAHSPIYCLSFPLSYLLLRSGNLRQPSQSLEYIFEQAVFSDILYKVHLNTGPNTWIYSKAPGEMIDLTNDTISNINFYLSDNISGYTPVFLRGAVWSVSFTIYEVLRPNVPLKKDPPAVLLSEPVPNPVARPSGAPADAMDEEEKNSKDARDARDVEELQGLRDKLVDEISSYKNQLERLGKRLTKPRS